MPEWRQDTFELSYLQDWALGCIFLHLWAYSLLHGVCVWISAPGGVVYSLNGKGYMLWEDPDGTIHKRVAKDDPPQHMWLLLSVIEAVKGPYAAAAAG